MFDETLIPILEEGLQKTRDIQRRLIARLHEAESEVELLRTEISALENSAAQTEKSITHYLVASRSGRPPIKFANSLMDDVVPKNDLVDRGKNVLREVSDATALPFRRDNKVAYLHQNRSIPSIANQSQPVSNRFSDRTIIQSCTLLLRESDRPMHVNELYNLLVAGGMKFKGNNPTISVAVSLSRSGRFRKTDPGTFDLDIREGLRVAS